MEVAYWGAAFVCTDPQPPDGDQDWVVVVGGAVVVVVDPVVVV